MGADDDVHFSDFQVFQSFLLFFFGAETAEHVDTDRKGGESAAKRPRDAGRRGRWWERGQRLVLNRLWP